MYHISKLQSIKVYVECACKFCNPKYCPIWYVLLIIDFSFNKNIHKKLFQDTSHQCQSKVLVFKPAQWLTREYSPSFRAYIQPCHRVSQSFVFSSSFTFFQLNTSARILRINSLLPPYSFIISFGTVLGNVFCLLCLFICSVSPWSIG